MKVYEVLQEPVGHSLPDYDVMAALQYVNHKMSAAVAGSE